MNKKIILTVLSCCVLSITFLTKNNIEPEINFYDVNFLRNSPAVEKVLKTRGFFEVDFKTNDNLMINAIMLDQSNNHTITTTVVSCPGFVPGRKEGMSTLYAMLADKPYNFIFIDSRGHGKSEGELLTFNGIKHYGESQYLDIVATIKFIIDYNKQHNIAPHIIIHGLCAGAFHTIKAVIYLKEHDTPAYQCIKGIIIDSGWPAITDIVETLTHAEATIRCQRYNVPFLQPYLACFMMTIYNSFFKDQHSQQIPLTDIIHKIEQPILFIHAENDIFVPIHHAHTLIAQSQKPSSWFVKESSHVASHLKHQKAYTHKIDFFIQSVL